MPSPHRKPKNNWPRMNADNTDLTVLGSDPFDPRSSAANYLSVYELRTLQLLVHILNIRLRKILKSEALVFFGKL